MAKELPYFKFEPSEWLEGNIQMCSNESIVCFLNLCSGYWIKLGCISYAFALHKYCNRNASVLIELKNNGVIDIVNDQIIIKFLDSQLKEVKQVSEKRRKAAEKRWEGVKNASALQVQSKSNAIREEEIREDNTSTIVDDKAIDKVYLKVRENYKTYAAQLLSDDIFISSISREFLKTNDKNIQKATLRKYLHEYINRLDQDKKVHNNKKQFMEHFPNWLRKQEINLVKPKKEKIRYV